MGVRAQATAFSRSIGFARRVVATAEHGRGLAIVATLALRWGASETPGGKETWFEIAVPASADGGNSGRIGCHNGPFGMDGGLSHGAAHREALAS